MSGFVGTLTFYMTDGETERELATLLNCQVNLQTDVFEALSPRFNAELQGWSATASMLDVIGSGLGSRSEVIVALESASFNGTELPVRIVNPGGAEYTGNAFVSRFSVSAQDDARVTGDFAIQGNGALAAS